jgi:predicted Zn-dependent protease
MPRSTRLLALMIPLALVFCTPAVAQNASLEARGQAAARAMSERRFDDAAATYREMLKAMPDEPGLLTNLGMALAMGGHEADAIAPLERALALKPGLVPAQSFLGSSYLALGEPEKAIAPLKRVVVARPADIEQRRQLAQAYAAAGRQKDAVNELRTITRLAPKLPAAWFTLGHAYNAMAQDAMGTFNDREEDVAWRQLLVADALMADGRLVDAFALYRATLERLPGMLVIHDSVARIYEQTGHPDWAARERTASTMSAAACVKRKAFCEFRAGRYRAALDAALADSDAESRYWRARASTELARAAFKQLDVLPDSRERREIRATMARAERRYSDAIAELQRALKFSPRDPALLEELGTTYYFARDYDKAVETLLPLVKGGAGDPRLLGMCGDALLQLQRVDEAVPLLQRAVDLDSSDSAARLALARGHIEKEYFAAAIPLIELDLATDSDGSLHVQLARAYKGLGNEEKAAQLLARSQEIQRAAQERSAAAGQRTITPPK